MIVLIQVELEMAFVATIRTHQTLHNLYEMKPAVKKKLSTINAIPALFHQ